MAKLVGRLPVVVTIGGIDFETEIDVDTLRPCNLNLQSTPPEPGSGKTRPFFSMSPSECAKRLDSSRSEKGLAKIRAYWNEHSEFGKLCKDTKKLKKVIDALNEGETQTSIQAKFGIGPYCMQKIVKLADSQPREWQELRTIAAAASVLPE